MLPRIHFKSLSLVFHLYNEENACYATNVTGFSLRSRVFTDRLSEIGRQLSLQMV